MAEIFVRNLREWAISRVLVCHEHQVDTALRVKGRRRKTAEVYRPGAQT